MSQAFVRENDEILTDGLLHNSTVMYLTGKIMESVCNTG
jgi:hypothetical protein